VNKYESHPTMTDSTTPKIGAQAPAATWQPEPELQQSPPRRITLTVWGHCLRLARVVLMIGVPAGMAIYGTLGKPELPQFFWIIAAILFAVFAPAFAYVEFWWLGRIRHVMRYGVPTAGTIVSIQHHGPGKHDVWRARYQFAGATGAMVDATSYVHTDDLEAIRRSPFVTILVDPADDRKSELYLGTLRYYRVVPGAAGG
jgi:hypothetical protein